MGIYHPTVNRNLPLPVMSFLMFVPDITQKKRAISINILIQTKVFFLENKKTIILSDF